MKRSAVEKERTKNQWRKHYADHVRQNVASGGQRGVTCGCDLQAGRFRKRKAFGCGRPRCLVCHSEKLMDIPRHRDRKRELAADV